MKNKDRNIYAILLFCAGLILVILILQSCVEETPLEPNNAPTIVTALDDLSLQEGFSSQKISFGSVFTDKDGDALTYTVTSSLESVATVEISSTQITLTEVGIGTTTITLTAQDTENESISDSFMVAISAKDNEQPTVTTALQDLTLDSGFETKEIDLPPHFKDTETQMLAFSATSSNEAVVTVSIKGPKLTILEIGSGSSTITVTALDEDGGMVNDAFEVTINAAENQAPKVASSITDKTLTKGFGSLEINISATFSDSDPNDQLSFGVVSNNEQVVTASISGSILTLSEVGIGSAMITLSAFDLSQASVSDEFEVTVSDEVVAECANDNSTNTDNWDCDETPSVSSSYSENISGDTRTIATNGIPSHDYRNQIPKVVTTLNSQTKNFTIDATPSLASASSSIVRNGTPLWKVGVALNGVSIDPAPGEPFIFENTQTGEYNWAWVMEPNNNREAVGLDCATAHVQPDGTYHYHGDMIVYADQLLSGLGSGSTVPQEPVQMGWASDGFPIVYKYGYDSNGDLKELMPSYSLKSGQRSGDGITEPCGEYNGKYTNDYEYVPNSGDLDECNGINKSIVLSDQTFDYYYVITEDFPVISRCLSGTPNQSFAVGGGKK